MMHSFLKASLAAASCAAAVGAAPAFAQSPAPDASRPAGAEGPVLVFEPGFFADFNPQTALDLVRRVPGFSVESGGGSRGLSGGLGNVLIDGRRPSSKAGLTTLLQRLPAATVARIELIRAPIPGVDMAGQDQVVNVITDRSGGWTGAGRARASIFESGRVSPTGEISATRTSPTDTLTLSVELEGHANGEDVDRTLFDAAGVLLRTSTERQQNRFWDVTPSLAYQRNFLSGHSLRVDARVWTWRFAGNRFALNADDADARIGAETSRSETEAYGTEVSADYDHQLSEVWAFKLTGLQRLTTEDENDVFDDLTPAGLLAGRVRVAETETEGETVLRAEARRAPSERRSLTLALEGAYNFLEGDFDLFVDDGSGEVEAELPISDTRVEEHRVDASAAQIWRPSDALTLEGVLGVEFSRIAQTGDAEKERSFTYFKPELTATWTPNPANQVRISLRRQVGQLSFGEFVSSVDVVDELTNLGNPDLQPERTWRLQADWERRFWDEGVVTVLIRHEWVDDVEDLIPVGGAFDAPGNIGDGRRLRVQINADIPTDRFGVPGGLLGVSAMARETRVDDPVTGVERRFRNDEDWRLSLDFRQDFPARGFAWGFDYYVQGDEDFYRLDEFSRVREPRGDLDVFAEARLPGGFTVQAGADLRLGEQERRRFRWPQTRAVGTPERVELRTRDFDGFAYLQVSAVF